MKNCQSAASLDELRWRNYSSWPLNNKLEGKVDEKVEKDLVSVFLPDSLVYKMKGLGCTNFVFSIVLK